MKNIALITTGGTVGTAVKDSIRVSGGRVSELFGDAFYRVLTPLDKLSENMDFADIIRIFKAVTSAADENPDGIIITHGTDSLPFTAAALSLLLKTCSKLPVMLVSSDKPLENKTANGHANMRAAIRNIEEKSAGGVFVPYKNKGQAVKIFDAVRLIESGDFDGSVRQAGKKSRPADEKKSAFFMSKILGNLDKIASTGDITALRVYPGTDYKRLAAYAGRDTEIILNGYHSGTARTDGENNINDLKCKVYLLGGTDGVTYESQTKLADNISVYNNIAFPAFYAKLVLSKALPYSERENFLRCNIAGEYF